MKEDHSYDDIIHLPHHVSEVRPRMSTLDRAAQFSSFAALTGYDAVIRETGRRTDAPPELDESRKAMLNEQLQLLLEMLETRPEVTVTWFVPDERKAGGACVSATGRVERLDAVRGILVLGDGTEIDFPRICALESGVFRSWE